MNKIILPFLIMFATSPLWTQTGSITIEKEIEISGSTVANVINQLKTKHGFTVEETTYPTPTAEHTDSTIYFSCLTSDGISSELRYSKKISSTDTATGISFTTTDEKWYNTESVKLAGLGFALTTNTLESETAKDAKIYEKDNITIEVFWSQYPGSTQKYYTIDVIRF